MSEAPKKTAKKAAKKAVKGKVGRPTVMTQAMQTKILDRMVEGESLRAICRTEGFPSVGTVLRFVADDVRFQEQYTRAREIGIEALLEECIEIADDGSNDYMETQKGGLMIDREVVDRSKLRIETRKWFASKMMPKKYGDKLELSGDKKNPIVTETTARVIMVPPKTPVETTVKPMPKESGDD